MSYYGLCGKFVSQPGKRDQLVTVLLNAARLLQENRDCINYIIGTTDEANDVWVFETWTSKRAHDSSLEPEDIKALVRSAIPLIVGSSNSVEWKVVGGKGL